MAEPWSTRCFGPTPGQLTRSPFANHLPFSVVRFGHTVNPGTLRSSLAPVRGAVA